MHDFFSESDLEEIGKIESVMITGSTGVLGQAMAREFTRLRHAGVFDGKIIQVSRSGKIFKASYSEIDKHFSGDLASLDFISGLPTVDYLFHFACPSEPSVFIRDPINTMMLNTFTTAKIRELAQKSFSFASTSEVYSGLKHPAKESERASLDISNPRSIYVESKILGELITLESHLNSETRMTRDNVFRFSLAYGEYTRFDDTRVLYQLVRRGLETGEVSLKGGHEFVRSYIYATDAARFALKAALSYDRQIVNIGTDHEVTLRDLAMEVANATGAMYVEKDLQNLDEHSGAPSYVGMNLEKMASLGPAYPFVSLSTGIALVVEHFRGFLDSDA